jgi:hypothetical protein
MKLELRNKVVEISNKLARIDDLIMQKDEIEHLGKENGYMSIYTSEDVNDIIELIERKIEIVEKELEELVKGLSVE